MPSTMFSFILRLAVPAATSFALYFGIHGCEEDKKPASLGITYESRGLSESAEGKLLFESSRSLVLTLTNVGELDAAIGELSFTRLDGEDLTAYGYTGGEYPGTDGTCTAGLAAGSSCTISISFSDPETETFRREEFEGTAILAYSDSTAGGVIRFSVGIALPAFIGVKHEAQDLVSYHFGGKSFGGSRSVMLTLANTGEMNATISTLTFKNTEGNAVAAFAYTGGSFPGTNGTCTEVLKPKAECSISITFTAPSETPYALTEYDAIASIAFNNGVETRAKTFLVYGSSSNCANGSGVAIEQLTKNTGSATAVSAADRYSAQSFSFPDSRMIKKVKLSQFKDIGTTLTGVKISFFDDLSGTPGSAPLAVYEYSDPGILEDNRAIFTYSLETPFTVSANTTYYLAVSYTGIAGGSVYTDKQTSEAESSGSFYHYNGTIWSSVSANDLTFTIETCLPETLDDPTAVYLE